MLASKSKVFIVDDDDSVCRCLLMLCESKEMEAEAYQSSFQFLAEYDPSTPGCLLLDIRMPEMEGTTLQQRLLKRNISIPIIFISGHADVPTAVQAMKLGAVDVIQKPFRNNLILECIEKAIQQDIQTRQSRMAAAHAKECMDSLSKREMEVLQLVCQGLHNKAIAQTLGISHKTIEFHRKNIMTKMQANSLIELAQKVSLLPRTQN